MKSIKGTSVVCALVLAGAISAAFAASPACARIRVVASITDLGSIASEIGGDQVEVVTIARPTDDVHHVEVLPSYMVRVSRAQLYLKVGLGLDQWADQIIDGSRNDHLLVVDCGEKIDPLEKPTGKVDASMGDVHPNGNPHYWLDPHNGAVVAGEIAQGLARLDPGHASDYQARADAFSREVDAVIGPAVQATSTLPVRALITYHSSWVYLAHALGLEIAGTAGRSPASRPPPSICRIWCSSSRSGGSGSSCRSRTSPTTREGSWPGRPG